jgi:hypothetical protein
MGCLAANLKNKLLFLYKEYLSINLFIIILEVSIWPTFQIFCVNFFSQHFLISIDQFCCVIIPFPNVLLLSKIQPESAINLWNMLLFTVEEIKACCKPCNSIQNFCSDTVHVIFTYFSLAKVSYTIKSEYSET